MFPWWCRPQCNEVDADDGEACTQTSTHRYVAHLEIAVDDALVVQVVHGPEKGPDEVSGLLLVVKRLGYDAVEQLATWTYKTPKVHQ